MNPWRISGFKWTLLAYSIHRSSSLLYKKCKGVVCWPLSKSMNWWSSYHIPLEFNLEINIRKVPLCQNYLIVMRIRVSWHFCSGITVFLLQYPWSVANWISCDIMSSWMRFFILREGQSHPLNFHEVLQNSYSVNLGSTIPYLNFDAIRS